jgi:hypothetical protein
MNKSYQKLASNVMLEEAAKENQQAAEKPPAVKLFFNDGREVPPEKILEMQAYAKKLKLKKSYRSMNEKRFDRKVADYFKIKLT